jgi:hypothetical protein
VRWSGRLAGPLGQQCQAVPTAGQKSALMMILVSVLVVSFGKPKAENSRTKKQYTDTQTD